MSCLNRELVFVILQFLDDEKFKETAHKLEQESGVFFNMKYFEDEVKNGNWDDVEKYLSGFTILYDNQYSTKIYFEIRKQKYLEALDKRDRSKAIEILLKDLKVFASYNQELFKELTQLLTLENFRENEQLSEYGDTKLARAVLLVVLKKLIEANPLFRGKLQFPDIKKSRLKSLVNQSLNWQHQLCENPRADPEIRTLFVDHSCDQPNDALTPSPANNSLLGQSLKAGGFPLGAHGPFQPTLSPLPTPLAGWMSNLPQVAHPSVFGSGAIGLCGSYIPAALKQPRASTYTSLEFSTVDSDHMSEKTRPLGINEEENPGIRFNEDGALLAVSSNENGIKILANSDDLRLLPTFEDLFYDAALRTPEAPKPAINNTILGAASATLTSAGLTKRVALNGDTRNLTDVKPKITEESNDKSKIWKLTEISESSQCRALKLPENKRATKISRLIYTNSGNAILALASNAIHLLWKWQLDECNLSGKATASISPHWWQPSSGIFMTNVAGNMNPEESVSCFALSKNDSYLMSASGGKVSLFNMMTYKTMTTLMAPPSAVTFLAFHPQDNNIIAIGMDDSTIQIYNVRVDEVKSKLEGHSKRITGLAFSHVLNVLVSSGADSQICVWRSDVWEKQKAKYLQLPLGQTAAAQSDTHVQFHQDQIHFLVVHETQLAIYEASKLECVKQWVPCESFAAISHATFSCDSQLVYACFLDATVCVFTASHLSLRCRINPSVYLSPSVLSNLNVHPLAVAAHPQEPNQFALGLSDGVVHVFEPLESEGKWGVPPPAENGPIAATSPARGSWSEQGQR